MENTLENIGSPEGCSLKESGRSNQDRTSSFLGAFSGFRWRVAGVLIRLSSFRGRFLFGLGSTGFCVCVLGREVLCADVVDCGFCCVVCFGFCGCGEGFAGFCLRCNFGGCLLGVDWEFCCAAVWFASCGALFLAESVPDWLCWGLLEAVPVEFLFGC